ncbi:hypothetical protein [Archangium violaceum]|uniref:hypothetical protein n=1 Tax=Archangium violaceum TaxID=83451 RepID=UPI0036DD6173
MATKKKQKPEDIVLFASLETEDDVEVEIAVHAPNRVSARRVIAEITRAVTGDDPNEANAGGRIIFSEGPGLPNRAQPKSEEAEG